MKLSKRVVCVCVVAVTSMTLSAFTPSEPPADEPQPTTSDEVEQPVDEPEQPAGSGADDVGLQSIDPARLLDTRGGATVDGKHSGGGGFAHQETRMIQIAGRGGIPQSATLAFLNVTAVGATQEGFLTVWPCESVTGSRPDTSVLNFREGWIRANGVTTALGAGGAVCVYAFGATDVLIDAQAYSSSDAFTAVNPKRVVDTRPNDERFAAGETRMYDLSSQVGDATAAFLNVTAVGNTEGGFLTTWPCTDTSTRRPDSSTLNFVPGAAVANNVFAAVNSGRICVYSYAATHVIVDLMGYMDADTPPVTAISPYRVVDTRRGTSAAVTSEYLAKYSRKEGGVGMGAGRLSESIYDSYLGGSWKNLPETRMFQIAGVGPIPLNADSVIANITTADSRHGTNGFLTVWPCSDPTDAVPNASALNYRSGWDVANTGVFALAEFGTLCVYAHEDAHVIIDVTGYTTSGVAPTGDIIAAVSAPEGGRSMIRVDVEPAGAAYDITFHGDQTFTETFTTPYAVTETDLPADNYWVTITASEGAHITSFDFTPWWSNDEMKAGQGIPGTDGICRLVDSIDEPWTSTGSKGTVYECDAPENSGISIAMTQPPSPRAEIGVGGTEIESWQEVFPSLSPAREITVTIDGDAGSYSAVVSQPIERFEGDSGEYEFRIMDLPAGKNTIRIEQDCGRVADCYRLDGGLDRHTFQHSLESYCLWEWCNLQNEIVGEVQSVMAWPDTLTSLKDSLSDLPELHWVPPHLPSSVTDLSHALYGSPRSTGNIALWDVSNVTNLDDFTGGQKILTDLSGWDVSNVTSMKDAFNLGVFATDSVRDWDVSNVTDMGGLHLSVSSSAECPNTEFSWFRHVPLRGHERRTSADFSNWDVSNVTDMSGVVTESCGAPPGIEHWNTSSVTNMTAMFEDALLPQTFNLNNWDTSAVAHMGFMFRWVSSDDGQVRFDIGDWDTSSLVSTREMFHGAEMSAPGIGNWDMSNVEDTNFMFARSTFNGDISQWDVSNLVVADGMFSNTWFNSDISGWQLPNLRSARAMFASAYAFNHDLSAWRTPQLVLFEGLFGRICGDSCSKYATYPQSVASWGLPKSDEILQAMWGDWLNDETSEGRSPTQWHIEMGSFSWYDDSPTDPRGIKALDFS